MQTLIPVHKYSQNIALTIIREAPTGDPSTEVVHLYDNVLGAGDGNFQVEWGNGHVTVQPDPDDESRWVGSVRVLDAPISIHQASENASEQKLRHDITDEMHLIFMTAPGTPDKLFVEAENSHGYSQPIGRWVPDPRNRENLTALVIKNPAALERHMLHLCKLCVSIDSLTGRMRAEEFAEWLNRDRVGLNPEQGRY